MIKFEIVGKIIGIALYNDVILNIPFPSLFFKKLLEKEIDFADLAEIEPELYISLNNLKKCSDEELELSDVTFLISYGGKEVKLKKMEIKLR